MKPYGNLSGNSGITDFEIGPDFIRVRFQNLDTYTYDYLKPGPGAVERMKTFALAGKGLSTYISGFVKDRYSSMT
jgi:hypothetical protein